MLISGMGVHQCMYVMKCMFTRIRLREREREEYVRLTRCVCLVLKSMALIMAW